MTAQTTAPQIKQTGSMFIDKVMSFQLPSMEEYLRYLTDMHFLLAIVVFACGLVYLLQGWRIFKVLVVVNAGILGAMLGTQVGAQLEGPNMPLVLGIAGGALLAILAWPLMKFAVAIMGALAGSLLGFGLWQYVAQVAGRADLTSYAWAGALLGLITLGLLAFVIFRLVIMIFTSFQGSVLAVSGLLAMLMKLESLHRSLGDSLRTNPHLMPLMIVIPAVIGLVFQHVGTKKGGKKPAG